MPDITLPTPGPGGTPGPQYAEMINTAIDSVNNVIETGRLSETELSATIEGVGDARYQRTAVLDAKGPSRQTDNLRYFRMSLARREAAAVRCAFTGHSLIEGEGATARTKRGTDRFRDIMRSRFPTPGVAGGYGYLGTAANATTWSGATMVTSSGGANSSQYGLNGNARFLNASGAYAQLEAIQCSAVDIVYIQSSSTANSFTTSVDGVANGDTKNTSGSTVATPALYRVPGISAPGSHSVRATYVAGNSIILGFIVYNGDETAGIRVYNGAWGGLTSAGLGDPTNVKRAGFQPYVPHLLVVTAFANDFKTGVAASTSFANLDTYLDQVRAVAPDTSIVLNIEHQLGNVGVPVYPWTDYVEAYYDLANDRGDVAVWDFWQRIGAGGPPPQAFAMGLIHPDFQHYSDTGALMWAEALAGFVSP